MWLLFSLCSALGASLVTLLIKLKLKDIDSLLLACIQFFVMFAVLFISCCIHKNSMTALTSINNKQWLFLGITGVIAAGAYFSYFVALKYGLAARVVAVDRLSIILVMALSMLVLGEKCTLLDCIGACLILVGTLLIAR
jgi:bacterial/archaeal transporter family protein